MVAMNAPDVTDHQIDAFRRLLMHLPGHSDLDLVVLKGHLLIEEQLHTIIKERMKKPEALNLESSNWGFDHVLSLAEALCGEEVHHDVWQFLRKLNKVRNDLAHKLESKGLEDRLGTS